MYTTIVLDLDGPILEGRERHYCCYAEILHELGKEPLQRENYWALKKSGIGRHQLLARSGAEAEYDFFLKKWLDDIEQPISLQRDVVQPGARETLEAWQNEGKRLILATMRQNEKNLLEQLNELNLRHFFDQVIQVGIDPIPLNKARQVERRVPNIARVEALWIGDTEIDYESARSLGLAVALLSCGLRDSAWLTKLGPDYLEVNLDALRLTLAEC